MRYAGIIYDDTAAAPGLCLSFYVQGCDIHCPGCHNPCTWNFDGGHEFTAETLDHIISGIKKNNILRNFSVLGGEPLARPNLFLTAMVIQEVRNTYPGIKIWVWTGHDMDELMIQNSNPHLRLILQNIDALVTGPFKQELRDITLPYCGSSNQEVWILDHEKNIWYNENDGRTYPNVRAREDE